MKCARCDGVGRIFAHATHNHDSQLGGQPCARCEETGAEPAKLRELYSERDVRRRFLRLKKTYGAELRAHLTTQAKEYVK